MTNVTKNVEKENEIAVSQNGMPLFDLSKPLPDLSKARETPIDLMADYWTPLERGEAKRVFFDRIGTRAVLDQQTGEVINLDCAFFVEIVKGEAKSVSNGSKRLVGALQNCNMQRGAAILITYKGKKTNTTNAFKSDDWSIKPLEIALS